MQSHNAIFQHNGGETVLTDSVFFIDRGTYPALLELGRELSPISVELEAYGDFLSPLGSKPYLPYLDSKANLVDPSTAPLVSEALQGRNNSL